MFSYGIGKWNLYFVDFNFLFRFYQRLVLNLCRSFPKIKRRVGRYMKPEMQFITGCLEWRIRARINMFWSLKNVEPKKCSHAQYLYLQKNLTGLKAIEWGQATNGEKYIKWLPTKRKKKIPTTPTGKKQADYRHGPTLYRYLYSEISRVFLFVYYFPFLSKVFCLTCFQHRKGLLVSSISDQR